jgi:hypothetical protein
MWGEKILVIKWRNINKEISYKKLNNLNKITQFTNLGKLLCKIKYKWENQTKKIVDRVGE